MSSRQHTIKRLLHKLEVMRSSDEKRELILQLFDQAFKYICEHPDTLKYRKFKEVLIVKIKEAMETSYMFAGKDRLKEHLLLLVDDVDWRPWLHEEKFPARFRSPLSTLLILAKGKV